jgi:uncharacterized protein (DUF1778 family)
MTKILKTITTVEKRLLNLKVTDEERKLIKLNADKYANGNISEWVRYASLNFLPEEKDLISDDTNN